MRAYVEPTRTPTREPEGDVSCVHAPARHLCVTCFVGGGKMQIRVSATRPVEKG